MTSPSATYSPAWTLGGWDRLSMCAYQVTRCEEWAMITIQLGSYGLRPDQITLPAPAARIGVYIGAAMSMPVWKCGQLPIGGSMPKPVQPNSWVMLPCIGQRSVPLYSDGMPPFASWSRTSCAI